MTKFCSQAPATCVFELSEIEVGIVSEPTIKRATFEGPPAVAVIREFDDRLSCEVPAERPHASGESKKIVTFAPGAI